MQIVDAMVHVIEEGFELPGRRMMSVHVTGDETVAMFDQQGVDGGLLVSSFSAYGYDPRYALQVANDHPDRFRVVAPVDPTRPDVAEFVADWQTKPHAVGLRLVISTGKQREQLESGQCTELFRAAAAHQLPICFASWGSLPTVGEVAAQYPELPVVIDHLGLSYPFVFPHVGEPWAELPFLLDLAQHPNVTVKITGAPTLSRDPFPYPDIWPGLHQIFERFGLERCMWGTDWTRATKVLTFEEGVRYMTETDELTPAELEQLMGKTLASVFGWSPDYNKP